MKNKKNTKQEFNAGKYLFLGILAAAGLYLIFTYFSKDETELRNESSLHEWAPETDSQFVKNCYDKYKPQIKDDMQKQEITKSFCRCMLNKIKSKYDEDNMNRVTPSEIKLWDTQCRNELKNPIFLGTN